jgi:hypothetical protein
VTDYRPANGGGSCARCGASLSLASLKIDDAWYCGTACVEGRAGKKVRAFSIPEPRLYVLPRRFYKKRRPRELRSARSGS